MTFRVADDRDAAAIADLVNTAYEVEAFFVAGDRTSTADIRRLMAGGVFLVAGTSDAIDGVVYTTTHGDRGYFGMLAVDPAQQGRGLGRALVAACEARAREAGCRAMDIKVVNLRTDLLALYGRLGYVEAGTEPYEHRPVLQPCQFVLMTKDL